MRNKILKTILIIFILLMIFGIETNAIVIKDIQKNTDVVSRGTASLLSILKYLEFIVPAVVFAVLFVKDCLKLYNEDSGINNEENIEDKREKIKKFVKKILLYIIIVIVIYYIIYIIGNGILSLSKDTGYTPSSIDYIKYHGRIVYFN